MQFLYFLPGPDQRPSDAHLRDIGLAHLVGEPFGTQGVHLGPEGLSGITLRLSRERGEFMYKPATQTWRKCNGGKFWLGWVQGQIPTPADLAREDLLPGHPITLNDGHAWTVPLARQFPDFAVVLPHTMGVNEDGKTVGRVIARYSSLADLADKIFWDVMIRHNLIEGEYQLNGADALMAGAVEALRHNYVLGIHEASALELFTSTNLPKVLAAVVDEPAITAAALQKKSMIATGSNTAPGGSASAPTTPPATPTCSNS